jgi:hypothetical protein
MHPQTATRRKTTQTVRIPLDTAALQQQRTAQDAASKVKVPELRTAFMNDHMHLHLF